MHSLKDIRSNVGLRTRDELLCFRLNSFDDGRASLNDTQIYLETLISNTRQCTRIFDAGTPIFTYNC